MALSSDDIEQVVETIIHGSEEKFVSELTETIVREFAEGFAYSAEVDLLTLSRAFPTKASVILLKYRDQISEEVQTEIEGVLNAAAEEDLANLAKIYGTVAAAEGASSHFAQVSKQTAIGVKQIIERQNVALSQSLQDTWYKVSAEAVTAVNQGLKPREKVLADGVVKLMGAGINVIPYQKNGKSTITNHVDVALRRHITTQVSQAGGRMSLDAMNLYNHDLVITDAHYGARESHAYWQGIPCCRSGQKTINGETYPDMVSLTEYGSVTGLKGANCRHMIFPYFPGITPLPDREFRAEQEHFGMTSDEYYQATQRQRELERRIRKTKREVAGLEQAGIGFENPTYVNKRLLLGKQQSTLKNFCKENNLVRLYEREKAYGVMKQPRALRVKPKSVKGLASNSAIEKWAKQFENETLSAILADGSKFRKEGTPLSVTLTSKEVKLLQGATISHTHTTSIGGTFSADDIELTMAISSPKHSVHSVLDDKTFTLERTSEATAESTAALTKNFTKEENETRHRMRISIWEKEYSHLELPIDSAGLIKAEKMVKSEMDKWLRRNAQAYGFSYRS